MRFARHVASALAGVVFAAIIVFVASSMGEETVPRDPTTPSPGASNIKVKERPERRGSDLLLAWAPTSSGGLPPATTGLLGDVKGVRAVSIASASLDWMISSTGSGGARIDDAPSGMRVPVEVVAIEPRTHRLVAPPSDRAAIEGLEPGEVLLSETSAKLRGDVTSVTLESGRYEVAGVISDSGANGYEMVVSGPAPAAWDIVDRFALVHAGHERSRERVKTTLKRALGPGQVLRVRAKGETPYLRYGDAVMPQAIIKESFGEFAARPLSDGTVAIDPRWAERNVIRSRVPILGEIVCHRALFPQLEDALREIRRKGLSFLIDTAQFGGCYGPRFIGRVPGGRLSHHAWGIAIDINAADNAFGTRPDLDRRLVAVMERFGFTWGGRWLVPDGMHFEWVRFP